MIIERLFPSKELPQVKGWWIRVAIINCIQCGILILSANLWDKWFLNSSDWSFRRQFSPLVGGFIGYIIMTFVFYWWHRVRHTNKFFWITFHQLHHSPSRIETITSFYKHPAEIIANSLIISVFTLGIFGLNVEQIGWVNFFSALGEYLYHMNVTTPKWWGYFFQRPEMHQIHHQRGVHFYNFGDLPVWDMLFGTYKNPTEHTAPCGFKDARETKLKDMLLFRDVNPKNGSSFYPVK
jgi:sterol desaturase/sphingolipid hydroxylase (fatty acid hydroxylase superfamily)